jgi:uncharacterized protein (TIGR02594 family)
MPDTVPPWLATMRQITGTLERPGEGADNPVILAWRDEIARTFPEMARYCAAYQHDRTPWCGLTVAYCMAHNGIRPVFGATDTDKFLWAEAWKTFGSPADQPRLGDVLVFQRHVTMYDGEDHDHYFCRGGNQSDSVNVTRFRKSACIAKRRPPAAEKVEHPSQAIIVPISSRRRFAGITATILGGEESQKRSAYDDHPITDDELGVALPARFSGTRPKVRVFRGNKAVVCEIVGVGPWNANDPYWETGSRPQAESGVDRSGRRTNLAGIDLTPGAARELGIEDKSQVDWEFVGAAGIMRGPAGDAVQGNLGHLLERLNRIAAALETRDQMVGIKPGVGQPQRDLSVLVQQLQAFLKIVDPHGKADDASPAAQSERLRRALQIIGGLIAGADGKAPLGQVNGALGVTIGNLLNGRKTGIGITGSLLTALLHNVPAGTGLADVLTKITPLAGFSGYALPIFLALGAWGVLGKMEKWSQGTAPPPRIPK